MHRTFFILLTIITFTTLAQQRDSQLALEYYKNKEFEKASVLYYKLFNSEFVQSRAKIYFNYYIKCLIELEDFNTAEKTIKKQIKKYSSDLTYYVEWGCLYKLQNNPAKASEKYELAVKKIRPDQHQIIKLANAFISKREYEYAEKVYLKGRKMFSASGGYSFNFELATIYLYQRNYQKMIDEYLDLLNESENYLQSVQNRLQSAIYSDIDNSLTELLKNRLLKRIQSPYSQNRTIFSELLIWLYIQERDFEQALFQAKALDKRNKEDGKRLIALARLAASNNYYNEAIEAYKYVIEKGHNSNFYFPAKNEYLNTLYKKVINTVKYTREDILELEKIYINTINELGERINTVFLLKDLAHIQAFYLDKKTEALNRLEKTLSIQGLKPKQIAECKMELGDILLLSGDVWEATLFYAQVEKANKDNPTGHQAKFKKAKLAYYTGNFEWAQAQLDILKASTSKLIANDAFELSLLINDNTALDTSETAMQMYARAELLIFQNKDSLALLTLDSILYGNIGFIHSLDDEILFLKAKVMQKKQDYYKATEFLQDIIDNYSYDILGDDALFNLAEIYEQKFNNTEKAKELYKNMLETYPGSIYTVESRKRYRKLRGDVVD